MRLVRANEFIKILNDSGNYERDALRWLQSTRSHLIRLSGEARASAEARQIGLEWFVFKRVKDVFGCVLPHLAQR